MATYAERINAARNINSPLCSKVIFALVDHGKWQLNPINEGHPGASPAKKDLAMSVLNNPDVYAWRFGAYVVTDPSFANVDPNEIDDAQILDMVTEAYAVFAPVLPAPLPEPE